MSTDINTVNLKLDIKVEKTVTVQIRKQETETHGYPWDWYVNDDNESSIRFATVEEAIEAARREFS